MAAPVNCEVSEGNSLRRKYDELRDLRCTQPEEEAKRLAASLEDVQRTSEALVSSLRSELELRADGDAAPAHAAPEDAAPPSAALTLEVEALRARVQQMETVVSVYAMFTGMSVVVGDDGRTVNCCCKGQERSHAFTVDMSPEDGDAGELGYAPASGDKACKELPDYLQEGIICARRPSPRPPSGRSTRPARSFYRLALALLRLLRIAQPMHT